MDTNPNYIEKCRMGMEIQASYTGYSRSLFSNDLDGQWPHLFTDWRDCVWWRTDAHNAIWLPRQDQLQEMVGASSIHKLLEDFTWWVCDWEDRAHDFCPAMPTEFNPRGYASMEELWLAFVMETKYGKMWNGREWVKG